jgi:uncharacterized membrane protein (DUF2068 family)
MLNLTGLAAGLARWSVFAPLALTIPLWALVALKGVWGVLWLVTAVGLWRLAAWARWAALIAAPVYSTIFIGQAALLAEGDYERGRLPFTIVLAILFNVFSFAVLAGRGARRAFGARLPVRTPKESKES